MRKFYVSSYICVVTIALHAQTVSTQYGAIQGHMNGDIYEFLGIPYASPPEDTLRWKPPVAPQSWTIPLIADSFPPKCPQKKYDIGDTSYTLKVKMIVCILIFGVRILQVPIR